MESAAFRWHVRMTSRRETYGLAPWTCETSRLEIQEAPPHLRACRRPCLGWADHPAWWAGVDYAWWFRTFSTRRGVFAGFCTAQSSNLWTPRLRSRVTSWSWQTTRWRPNWRTRSWRGKWRRTWKIQRRYQRCQRRRTRSLRTRTTRKTCKSSNLGRIKFAILILVQFFISTLFLHEIFEI